MAFIARGPAHVRCSTERCGASRPGNMPCPYPGSHDKVQEYPRRAVLAGMTWSFDAPYVRLGRGEKERASKKKITEGNIQWRGAQVVCAAGVRGRECAKKFLEEFDHNMKVSSSDQNSANSVKT